VLSALTDIKFQPGHNSAENLFLSAHIELVTGDDVNQLGHRQEQKLFTLHDLSEIVLSEFIRNAKQLATRVRVSKSAYSQAIRGVKLSLEELAANILNLSQLEEAGGGQQSLDVVLLNLDVRRVAKVDEQLHGVLINIPDDNLRLPRLGQLVGEHGPEVGAARTQDDPVRKDLATADVEDDVAQLPVASQDVELGEHSPRVFIRGVGQPRGRRRPLTQHQVAHGLSPLAEGPLQPQWGQHPPPNRVNLKVADTGLRWGFSLQEVAGLFRGVYEPLRLSSTSQEERAWTRGGPRGAGRRTSRKVLYLQSSAEYLSNMAVTSLISSIILRCSWHLVSVTLTSVLRSPDNLRELRGLFIFLLQ
jgi:hypothetical protein